MSDSSRKAVVLFSGGLDSTTVLALAKQQDHHVHALTFRYGQRHAAELKASQTIASHMGVEAYWVIPLFTEAFAQASSLTNPALSVPEYLPHGPSLVPNTYVPARNTLFLAYALAYAEAHAIDTIMIGVSSVDYSGYPDCRPAFVAAFNQLAQLATQATSSGARCIRIEAPLLHLSKADTIRLGTKLGVPYELTLSCYQPTEDLACNRCEACALRRQGFAEAGLADPTRYR